MDCNACQTTNPDDNAFCENCGVRIAPAPVLPDSCSCGTPLSEMDSDGFCGGCGRRLKRPDSDHIEVTLQHDFAGVSDRGLRHSRNEDRFAIATLDNAYAMVVCDGVSMSPDADEAAAAAVQSAIEALKQGLAKEGRVETHVEAGAAAPVESSDVELIKSAVNQAAAAVSVLAQQRAEAPATTLVAAIARNNSITVGWIGDSRAYWLNGEGATQITRDHTGDEAQRAANMHALARWVGADSPDLEPEIAQQPMTASGLLLLCSDGLWNYTADSGQMAELVERVNLPGSSALAVTRELIEFARSKGGHDNITAVVLRHPISEEPSNGG